MWWTSISSKSCGLNVVDIYVLLYFKQLIVNFQFVYFHYVYNSYCTYVNNSVEVA